MVSLRAVNGFTLVELLVIMAILGILITILMPNLLGARRAANDTVSLTCGRGLAQAAISAKLDGGPDSSYPTAQLLLQKPALRRCTDPLLTITTVSASTTDFKYLITHSSGNHTYVVTRQGIKPQD